MCQFSVKIDNFDFFHPILPKNGFRANEKCNLGIRMKILEILCVSIFSQYEELWLFRPEFAQKWILGSEFQKSKSGFGISTSKMPCEPVFRQNEFLGLNLGKLPNYVRYFGSNIVEGVAESWMETEMSWVDVNGAGWSLK